MALRGIYAALAILNGLNGIYMLIDPAGWYAATPGVAGTGPFNSHFVRDIGFAYFFSGVFWALALIDRRSAFQFAIAAAAWPLGHALFHLAESLAHGLPQDGTALTLEIFGVILASFIGAAAAALSPRNRSE